MRRPTVSAALICLLSGLLVSATTWAEPSAPLVATPTSQPVARALASPPSPASSAPTALKIVTPPLILRAEAPPQKKASVRLAFRPGKGLDVRSSDGRFALTTRLRAQFRYDVEDGAGDTEHSLQIRRARLQFGGNFYGKHNRFKVEIAISPRDVGLGDSGVKRTPLLSWFMDFTHLRDLNFRVGQFKVLYNRQRVISSGDLQLVDRSIVNGEFNLDRDVAISLFSRNLFGSKLVSYYLTLGIGEGRDAFKASDFGLLYIARVEVNPFGAFKDYREGDFTREQRFRLSLGAAYSYVAKAPRNRGIIGSEVADGGTTNTHNATVDLMAKWRGLSMLTAWMWRKGSRNPGDATDETGQPIAIEAPRDGHGLQTQLGYIFPFPFEVAARWATIWGKDEGSLETRSELGGGVSYYFAGHPLKLQADFFHYWNGTRFRGNDREQQFRLQLQASF